MEEITDMALQDGAGNHAPHGRTLGDHFFIETTEGLPPAYRHLKMRWDEFIDNLMEEYRIQNILSVLLLPTIMSIFQIKGAGGDPITRYVAFGSLICALMSLLYGCMLSARFGTMRKGYKAAEWALEAKNELNAYWNVWIMLATPLIWLTWSMLMFIICIMSFMWRSPANLPDNFSFSISSRAELSFRILVCCVLGLGMIYSALIARTLRQYGSQMDNAWRPRIHDYIRDCQAAREKSAEGSQYAPGPAVESPQSVSPGPPGDYPIA
ncbi:hypothetical protein P691DRAFT_855674 [Macrolepiota fuliginosa MF-IS2]|uniref:Transmembrane protein n=1 Tax=Macrolepiota fuliginosa MF-IS2 TaxID=1400762 RepID=A0A9P5X0F7_9AGAR|nr:hypothetical protein P691DRAFT_855674 [Macrolepiota fuliginosa MF-IS2]